MNFKKKYFILILLIGVSTFSVGQKIKYKDLIVLLLAKQYDQAEPFLKKYLKDNQDNPNALLFMGNIYEEKAYSNDPLIETERQGLNTDSAVLFLDRAFKGITERELNKNEEYYQAYSRRDLRTGKFGIKLSDVQFDLEKRIKALKDRKQRVVLVKEKFLFTQLIYGHCEKNFIRIADRFGNQREFYLRADEELGAGLRNLSRKFDSCLVAFNDYRAALGGLGKTGHNQELNPREIIDFKKDGRASVDFLQDELALWDYKRWALSNTATIENEVMPMMAFIEKIDNELNALKEKVTKDSSSVKIELSAIKSKINATDLKKFDPKSIPQEIFVWKVQELEYGSELSVTKVLRDSSDLRLKLSLYKTQIKLLRGVDSLSSLLLHSDLDYEIENYQSSIKKSYGSAANLKTILKSSSDFAVTQKAEKEKLVSKLQEGLNWMLDKSDSIPCQPNVISKKYFPITIIPENHTFGLNFTDSTQAYFYTITPSRKSTIKAKFQVDTATFTQEKLPITKGLSVSDDLRQTFYVILYSEELKNDKVPVLIFKVSKGTGLVWSNYFAFDGKPTEATYGKLGGELSIKLSTNGGNKIVTIQPDGKQ